MENTTPTKQKSLNVNDSEVKCPFHGGALKKTAGGGTRNSDWWPNALKLNTLSQQSSRESAGLTNLGALLRAKMDNAEK